MNTETTTESTAGGFVGDPAEAFNPPAASDCCGGATTAKSDCCGLPAETAQTASGSGCCG